MEFCFEIMPATRPDLKNQLARGLDLRTELKSRRKFPGLWKKTDEWNEKNTDDALKRRKTKNTVFGIFFLLLGIFLLVPGLKTGGPQRASGGRRYRFVCRYQLSFPKIQKSAKKMPTNGTKTAGYAKNHSLCAGTFY